MTAAVYALLNMRREKRENAPSHQEIGSCADDIMRHHELRQKVLEACPCFFTCVHIP